MWQRQGSRRKAGETEEGCASAWGRAPAFLGFAGSPGVRAAYRPRGRDGEGSVPGNRGKEEPWARVTQPWGCSSSGSAAATRPLGEQEITSKPQRGREMIWVKSEPYSQTRLQSVCDEGCPGPPGCEGNPRSPTSAQDAKAAADFGCFAGHNASLVSAAGRWDF